jgi:GGDEF domain-containing protein
VFLLLALLTARVRRDRETLARSNQALHTLAEREAALARLDPLTGLLNARAFRDALSTELTLARAR